MSVGRKRKDGNPLGLEPRVEWHHGQFRYLHRDGRKEGLGTDIGAANARARVYNDPEGRFGTVGHFLDTYNADAAAGRLHKKLSPRTIADNLIEAEWLKSYFGKMMPLDLVNDPSQIAKYRDQRSNTVDGVKGAPVRANRELSLLSAMYTWLIQSGLQPGLIVNPVKLIQRNAEKAKDRYVEDAEYLPVYSIALRPICMAMRLAYMTLQRPADVLRLAPPCVRKKSVGGVETRVLSVTQGKRGRTVDIEITPELDEVLKMLSPDGELDKIKLSESVTKIVPVLVHTPDIAAYSESGVRAMLRRYCVKAKVRPFGLMDLRAKGATDMYLNGVPLEKIQILMRHRSVKTTEIYIKRLLETIQIATPNRVQISA